jgi:hypothetical protein
MQKLYCYVDESGQDTKGSLYIVSAIIMESERDELTRLLEQIEKRSGKGTNKWTKARPERRAAYIRAVLQTSAFKNKLNYGLYPGTQKYVEATISMTAETITSYVLDEKYKANVLVDGLRDSERNAFAVGLRKQGIRTGEVKGVDDENDALIRLADAICGFVRDALNNSAELKKLVDKAVQQGYLIQRGKK